MLQEHNDNQFTKEKDEVEKYLMRIIQRYFDIENNFTKESIEAIILESLTRFKQIMISEKGFIFSLNKQTGHLTLTIRDFSGEQAFDKNTAFNKNFGTEADTICEGNDERLYDDRNPLEHVHEIADVKGLQEELDKVGFIKSLHTHENKTVLDMIQYSGTKAQIDLIIIEELQKAIQEYYKNLQGYQAELNTLQSKSIETLTLYMPQLQQTLNDLKFIVTSAVNWLQDAYNYTDDKTKKYKANVMQELKKYITKAQLQSLMDFFDKPYRIVGDGEFPLEDGKVTFTPVEEKAEAGSGQGDSLLKIYNEGLRLGYDDWQWDSVNQSFVYQSNEMNSYPMFISLSKYQTYTHRVTLTSKGTDNDCISVVIAYDEKTGNHLSLVVAHGGVLASGQSGTNANVMLNFTGASHTMAGSLLIDHAKLSSSSANWNSLTEGITILVKRTINNIKIWALYNTAHSWIPSETDGVKDIYPSEAPTFEFELTDYPELSCFVDRACNYGYGCFSQPYSTYEDVYFIGIYDEMYGHTDIMDSKTTEYIVPASVIHQTNNPRIKLFFRYDQEDGTAVTTPLPFCFQNEYGNNIVVQGASTSAGEIIINSNFMNTLPLYVHQLYDEDTIIVCNSIDRYSFARLTAYLESIYCTPCLIDSQAKNDYVTSLLTSGIKYYIDGTRLFDEEYYDINFNEMSYTNWAESHPNMDDHTFVNIAITDDSKWYSVNCAEKLGFVAEYKIQKMTKYFKNPRIYYQVLGNKEVV